MFMWSLGPPYEAAQLGASFPCTLSLDPQKLFLFFRPLLSSLALKPQPGRGSFNA